MVNAVFLHFSGAKWPLLELLGAKFVSHAPLHLAPLPLKSAYGNSYNERLIEKSHVFYRMEPTSMTLSDLHTSTV